DLALGLQLDQLVDDPRVGERVVGDVDRFVGPVQEGQVVADAVVVRSEDGLDAVLRIDTAVDAVTDEGAATEDNDQCHKADEQLLLHAHGNPLPVNGSGLVGVARRWFLPRSQVKPRSRKAPAANATAENTALRSCTPVVPPRSTPVEWIMLLGS